MNLVRRADLGECRGITKARFNRRGPGTKFSTAPFEPVVWMSKGADGQIRKEYIVFRVRRGDNHGLRSRHSKHDLRQCGQPIGVKMFNHFRQNRRINVFPTRVTVGQRAVKKCNAVGGWSTGGFQPQPLGRMLERACRGVQTDQARDAFVADEAREQLSLILATPAIDALGKSGTVVAASRVDVGRAPIGVAIRDGATAPDIATPEAFKAALAAAPRIALSDPAVGGSP
jgi:hypothetical protein